MLNCELRTLQQKQQLVLTGTVARRNSIMKKAKPLHNLTRPDLEHELASRGVFKDGNVKVLQKELDSLTCGQQRVPALLFNCPQASLKNLCLCNYEVLPAEPLHDVGHHIENVFVEFPKHLKPSEEKAVDNTYNIAMGNKDSKRIADYRSALVQTAAVLQKSGALSSRALAVLKSLVEIQRIIYSPEEKRTPALILRYHNQA